VTSKQLNEPHPIDIDIDEQDPRELVDDERNTVLFLKAVTGEISATDALRGDLDLDLHSRSERMLRDAARSADEAARLVHRQRVVAPLLMLLALGLLLAAAGSSC